MLVFGLQGWFGPWLTEHDVKIIFAVPGIVLATIFVTVPYGARADTAHGAGTEEEEGRGAVGRMAGRFFHATLPNVKWGLFMV